MKIKNYLEFLTERIRLNDIDVKNKKTTKYTFINKIEEYRKSIKESNLDKLDIKIMLRELYNQFTEELIKDLNTEDFLKRVNRILEDKELDKIDQTFNSYLKKIDKKFKI